MAREPTVAALLSRFQGELHNTFYPFFILTVIDACGDATRQDIKEEICSLTHGTFDMEDASLKRLVGRIEKTFGLIEPVKKEKDLARVRYALTGKGERLLADTLDKVVRPLANALPQ